MRDRSTTVKHKHSAQYSQCKAMAISARVMAIMLYNTDTTYIVPCIMYKHTLYLHYGTSVHVFCNAKYIVHI